MCMWCLCFAIGVMCAILERNREKRVDAVSGGGWNGGGEVKWCGDTCHVCHMTSRLGVVYIWGMGNPTAQWGWNKILVGLKNKQPF